MSSQLQARTIDIGYRVERSLAEGLGKMPGDVALGEFESMYTNYYFTLIAISILISDYCLTFDEEVERFWAIGRLTWASGFFYLNRYLALFGHIPIMLEFFWTTSLPSKFKICQQLQSYHQYLAITIQVIVACMLIMRMYALYEKSRKVLAFYISVALIVIIIGCWAVLGGKPSHKPLDVLVPIGCGVTLTRDQSIRLGAAWVGLLVFDSLVFGMTLYKSISLSRSRSANLLSVLLRDGAVYFGVMVCSNLGNILTFMFGSPFTRGVATTFTNIISSVMISRLMLNLRDPALLPRKEASGPDGTAETTYELTSVEPQFSTQRSDSGVLDITNSNQVYDYLSLRPGWPSGSQGIEIVPIHSGSYV